MKPLLNWQKSIFVDEDIGGTAYNVCEYCGGKKVFEKGDSDYGDNTHQYIQCSLCGWRGSREIIYKSDDYRKSYFNSSILMKFTKKKRATDKLKIELSSMKSIIFSRLEDGYAVQINNFFHLLKTDQFEELIDIKINWKQKEISFHFDKESYIFNFATSMKILRFLDLINYDLQKDYEFLQKFVIKTQETGEDK